VKLNFRQKTDQPEVVVMDVTKTSIERPIHPLLAKARIGIENINRRLKIFKPENF
jgi:hypothetical protein